MVSGFISFGSRVASVVRGVHLQLMGTFVSIGRYDFVMISFPMAKMQKTVPDD